MRTLLPGVLLPTVGCFRRASAINAKIAIVFVVPPRYYAETAVVFVVPPRKAQKAQAKTKTNCAALVCFSRFCLVPFAPEYGVCHLAACNGCIDF